MFRYAHPEALYGLLLVPAVALLVVWAMAQRRRALRRFAEDRLAVRLAEGVSRARRWVKAGVVMAALASLAVAAARPQFGTRLQTVTRQGHDIVVALDLSVSMLAEDVPPNRLEKAKHAVGTLLDRLRGDRVALVGFAGRAFVQCPLTLDHGAARTFLNAMDTTVIPVQGTAVAEAVRKSAALFETGERKHKALILLTDGEDHGGEAAEAVREAAGQGVVLFVVGVGTERGAPIPIKDAQGRPSGFKKDEQGQVVVSRLREDSLRALSAETGGDYFRLSASENEMGQIYDQISGVGGKTVATQEFAQYNEQFQIFVAAALALLALELFIAERRSEKRRWRA